MSIQLIFTKSKMMEDRIPVMMIMVLDVAITELMSFVKLVFEANDFVLVLVFIVGL